MGEPRRCWLRWHNYSNSVTSALESLRYDEDFLDVTIACDGHSIRAHKLVLSACSAYFRKVLKDHPCDHPIIILDGLGWQVVVSLLHFMYCGEVVVEEELLPNLLTAATNLDVTGLTHLTSAIISAQVTKDISTEPSVENEDYNDDEDVYDDDDDCDDDYDEDEQPLKISEEVQRSPNNEEDLESDEGSPSETEAPPSKRSRVSSCDAEPNVQMETQKDLNSTKSVSSTIPKETGIKTQQKVTNGLSSLTLPLCHAATPHVDLPSSDSNDSIKRDDLQSDSKSSSDTVNSKCKVNGNSSIKEEDMNDEDNFSDFENSNSPENGDSDILTTSLPISFGKSGAVINEGLLESCAPVGITSMPPVNFATLLASGKILPSAVNSSPASTIVISAKGASAKSTTESKINLDNVVQQILFPSSTPASGTVALSTVPTLTTTATPATATCAPPTSTSSLSTSNSGQQYIHPSVVSLQEVQATLEQYQRKLAFHEPRPCPTCRRMYRDAATLRTHMAIMHSEGKEPYACTCGALFRTKYDMYQHKKNGHR